MTKITTLQGDVFKTLALDSNFKPNFSDTSLENQSTSLSANEIALANETALQDEQKLNKTKMWIAILVGIATLYAFSQGENKVESQI